MVDSPAAKIVTRLAVPNPNRPSYVLASLTAVVVSWGGAARAQTLAIASDQTLSGDQIYQEVTIDAEVSVPAFDPGQPGTGWIRIFADRIVIGEAGRIDADGAGYDGTELGPGSGGANQPANADQPAPGGGGAHVGAGAPGAWGEAQASCPSQNGALCQVYAAAPGGIPYEDPMNPLALAVDPTAGMGSAGGRSWAGCPNPSSSIAGGAGGGTILLYANQIDLRGSLLARGAPLAPGALLSPGGGAGGTIILSAQTTLSLGSGAELRVDGAAGVQGNAVGGGGGGGLIVVATPTDVADLLATDCPAAVPCTGVAAGSSAPCMEVGGAGARVSRPPLPCPDADGDGFANSGCLDPVATDCNDADPLVNTDADEICDGVDNDCDGGTDENPDDLCPASLTCVEGECEPISSSAAGGANPSPPPPRIELAGGLCAFRSASRPGPLRSSVAWIATLALLGLFGRRRRR